MRVYLACFLALLICLSAAFLIGWHTGHGWASKEYERGKLDGKKECEADCQSKIVVDAPPGCTWDGVKAVGCTAEEQLAYCRNRNNPYSEHCFKVLSDALFNIPKVSHKTAKPKPPCDTCARFDQQDKKFDQIFNILEDLKRRQNLSVGSGVTWTPVWLNEDLSQVIKPELGTDELRINQTPLSNYPDFIVMPAPDKPSQAAPQILQPNGPGAFLPNFVPPGVPRAPEAVTTPEPCTFLMAGAGLLVIWRVA